MRVVHYTRFRLLQWAQSCLPSLSLTCTTSTASVGAPAPASALLLALALATWALRLDGQRLAVGQRGPVQCHHGGLQGSGVYVVDESESLAHAVVTHHGPHTLRWDRSKGSEDLVQVQIRRVRGQASDVQSHFVVGVAVASRQSLGHAQATDDLRDAAALSAALFFAFATF